jgi:hypothetical protein
MCRVGEECTHRTVIIDAIGTAAIITIIAIEGAQTSAG